MRVRHLIAEAKTITADTLWSAGDLPPRHAPVYTRTRPMRGSWRWRSARCSGPGRRYHLVAECDPPRDNWKAMLLIETGPGWSVVARYEDHASHPGRHVHSDCARSGAEIGAASLDDLPRLPRADRYHRVVQARTETTFWEEVKDFFNVAVDNGPLFRAGGLGGP